MKKAILVLLPLLMLGTAYAYTTLKVDDTTVSTSTSEGTTSATDSGTNTAPAPAMPSTDATTDQGTAGTDSSMPAGSNNGAED